MQRLRGPPLPCRPPADNGSQPPGSAPCCRADAACRSASRCARTLNASSSSGFKSKAGLSAGLMAEPVSPPCSGRGLPGFADSSASCELLPEPVPRRSGGSEPDGSRCCCCCCSPSETLPAVVSEAAVASAARAARAASGQAASSSVRSGLAVAGVHSPDRKKRSQLEQHIKN